MKPGFFTNEVLAEVPPIGRLLFQGAWCLADRAGRLEDRPKKIKAEVLPYDDCDVDAMLWALHRRGFIRRYANNGVRYIQVLAFTKHQNPHVKEAHSTIPAPDEHGSSTVPDPEIPERAGLIPDSLIPDSGFPMVVATQPVGLSPDSAPPNGQRTVNGSKADKSLVTANAKEILAFLNEKAGKNFPASDSNVGIIVARLKEGFLPAQIRKVIAMKVREWRSEPDMVKYLRPETLFGRTKFSNYVGELVEVPDDAP